MANLLTLNSCFFFHPLAGKPHPFLSSFNSPGLSLLAPRKKLPSTHHHHHHLRYPLQPCICLHLIKRIAPHHHRICHRHRHSVRSPRFSLTSITPLPEPSPNHCLFFFVRRALYHVRKEQPPIRQHQFNQQEAKESKEGQVTSEPICRLYSQLSTRGQRCGLEQSLLRQQRPGPERRRL